MFEIYALFDPAESDHIRYIGITKKGAINRYFRHVNGAIDRFQKNKSLHYKHNWILKVIAEGRLPDFRVINNTDTEANAKKLERVYILEYKAEGHKLTNQTGGGEGMFNPSPELRAKMKIAVKAAQANPKTKEKQRVAQKIRWARPEERSRQSAQMKITLTNPEIKAKYAAGAKAAWANPKIRSRREAVRAKPEAKEKIRAALANPEVKAKHRAGMLARYTKPEERAKTSIAAKIAWAKQNDFIKFVVAFIEERN